MKTIPFLVRTLTSLGLAMSLHAEDPAGARVPVTRFGAVGDGETINTAAIQKTIDSLAANGGGTMEIPEGVFMSGALFLKPGVNLHLAKGAVLRCLTDMKLMDITLENVDVKAGNTDFQTSDKVRNLRIHNVKVNGKPYP